MALSHSEQAPRNDSQHPPVHELPFPERLTVWAARVWVEAHRAGSTSCKRLDSLFRHAGLEDCIGPFYSLFTLLAHGARRKLTIQCPCCRHLGDDERLLLILMTAHQQGQPHRAESILKDWLHPAAVRQAAYPAQLLAQGFAENGFALRLLTYSMDATVIPCDRTLH